MNDEQLDRMLSELKSSVVQPDHVDASLVSRMKKEQSMLSTRKTRLNRTIAAAAILMVLGTGFVATGGDNAIRGMFSGTPQVDENGNPVQTESYWSYFLRHVHAHLHGVSPKKTAPPKNVPE